MASSILLTGFINTHTALQLLNQGFNVTIIIDNLHNSAVHRLRDLVAPQLSLNLQFHLGDIRNREDLEKLFSQAKFDAVIHFAGLKDVGESMARPFRCLDSNLIGSVTLFQVMAKYNCKKLVFSYSASLYGQPKKIPCVGDFELKAMNPYGRTKLFLEEFAQDIHTVDPEWKIVLLICFNPVGAHESWKLDEDPIGIPNNLMPFIHQVAFGRLPDLKVNGHSYPTRDHTRVRDYIHVMDLADDHVEALKKLFTKQDMGCFSCNHGTGHHTSVLEMVTAFEKASSKVLKPVTMSISRQPYYLQKMPIKWCPKRPRDVTKGYPSRRQDRTHGDIIRSHQPKNGIEQMCWHQWNWARYKPLVFSSCVHMIYAMLKIK